MQLPNHIISIQYITIPRTLIGNRRGLPPIDLHLLLFLLANNGETFGLRDLARVCRTGVVGVQFAIHRLKERGFLREIQSDLDRDQNVIFQFHAFEKPRRGRRV